MIAVGVLVGLMVAGWAVALCLSRVRRLHRLHIRVDAARAGLDAALARRAAAASAAGVVVPGGLATGTTPASRRPRSTMAVPRAAVDAEAGASVPGRLWSTAVPHPAVDTEAGASVPGRLWSTTTMPQAVVDPEAAANALGRALARLDRATLPADVRAALTDAEQLLVLARRVHNDAVRDTLGLRSRRLVRWLRLAGTAPMPAYFEIADPVPALKYDRVSPSQE
ncbi:MAG TPA: NUDIX hydrolase [Pseudonocardia sp.]|nr:NUDIX hydrolase [Pseudonocardia sp.]